VLGVAQIRYCKTEKVRIDAFENVINNAYDHEVDRFNRIVNDYNSRCGEFRYRRGDVERVERELAPMVASITSAAKSEWVRGSLGLDSPKKAPAPKTAPAVQTDRPKAEATMDSLSYAEKESIESACSVQKTLYGPAEYNKCVSGKLSALKAGPRNIDLSGLSYAEKESIESACSVQKTLYGPAEYNKCLTQKLRQMR